MAAAISGLNHLTLAVADIDRSLAFYRDVLGCRLRAIWPEGAYLEAGSLWLCLSRDASVNSLPRQDYTHIAFSICDADSAAMRDRLSAACVIWKQDRSEGASTYFLDPDGHQLEIHTGSLESRLSHYLSNPSEGVSVLEI